MKKIFFIFSIFSICTTGFSQTEKGSWLIGGSANGGTRLNNNTYNYYAFSLNPQAGYFLFNNFAIGLAPGFGFGHESLIKNTSLSIGPFLRYYIGKSKLRVFIETIPGYSQTNYNYKNPINNLKDTYKTWSESSSVGVVYFISKNIGLEAKVNYIYSKEKRHSNYTSGFSDPGVNSLYLRVGFQIYLPAKKKEDLNLPVSK